MQDTATQGLLQYKALWSIYADGKLLYRRYNTQTTFGLNAYSSAYASGTYTPPAFLAVYSWYGTITSISGTTLVLSQAVHNSGDTQLYLNPGLNALNGEVVTFSSVVGSTYTLTAPPVNTHNVGEIVVRNAMATDTIASYTNEVEPDTTGVRIPLTSYTQTGSASYNLYYLITGTQCLLAPVNGVPQPLTTSHLCLNDSQLLNSGNHHNVLVSGNIHNYLQDWQISVNITLGGA